MFVLSVLVVTGKADGIPLNNSQRLRGVEP